MTFGEQLTIGEVDMVVEKFIFTREVEMGQTALELIEEV